MHKEGSDSHEMLAANPHTYLVSKEKGNPDNVRRDLVIAWSVQRDYRPSPGVIWNVTVHPVMTDPREGLRVRPVNLKELPENYDFELMEIPPGMLHIWENEAYEKHCQAKMDPIHPA